MYPSHWSGVSESTGIAVMVKGELVLVSDVPFFVMRIFAFSVGISGMIQLKIRFPEGMVLLSVVQLSPSSGVNSNVKEFAGPP